MPQNPPIDSSVHPDAGPDFEILVFDLGGVLVELSKETLFLSWTDLDAPAFWSTWLSSSAVRQFERGAISPEAFAEAIIQELHIPVSPADFLKAFETWPRSLYPGTHSLLHELQGKYPLGCMSNTNTVHWPYLRDELGLEAYFQHTFISCETGLLKPDQKAYLAMINSLAIPPHKIVFFDDNEINAQAAEACGILAYTVHGIEELKGTLTKLGILSPDRKTPN